MPAPKYDHPVRLPGQWWPDALVQDAKAAARRRGWNMTQWLQEAARDALKRQTKRESRETA